MHIDCKLNFDCSWTSFYRIQILCVLPIHVLMCHCFLKKLSSHKKHQCTSLTLNLTDNLTRSWHNVSLPYIFQTNGSRTVFVVKSVSLILITIVAFSVINSFSCVFFLTFWLLTQEFSLQINICLFVWLYFCPFLLFVNNFFLIVLVCLSDSK